MRVADGWPVVWNRIAVRAGAGRRICHHPVCCRALARDALTLLSLQAAAQASAVAPVPAYLDALEMIDGRSAIRPQKLYFATSLTAVGLSLPFRREIRLR